MKLNFQKIKHLKSIDRLKVSSDDYVIGGSAAAILYGAKDANDGIDIAMPRDTIQKLFRSGKVIKGVQDDIHDDYYQSEDGHLDIAPPEISIMFPEWGWEDWKRGSMLFEGYRFMTKEALITFYTKLANHTKAEKHKSVLARLKDPNK